MSPKSKSRITIACNSCRLRKQKCSGNRPTCMQCLQHRRSCDWPEQLRRGPSKGYIEALEHRLHETENLLLGLLAQISDSQLSDSIPHHSTQLPPRPGKQGGEYWKRFPLASVQGIRSWQDDCLRGEGGSEPEPSFTSTHQVPNPIYPHTPFTNATKVVQNRPLSFRTTDTGPDPGPEANPECGIAEVEPSVSVWSEAPSVNFQQQFLW